MENFKNYNLRLLLIISIIVSSCATISYTPIVSLDVSNKTIKRTVKVENLVDKTPAKQKKKPIGGFSVTNSESLAGDLSVEVTNAIINDFNTNGVFSNINKRVENPDLILKGEIIKFEGKYKPTVALWVTIPVDILWFLGIPIYREYIDIEIKLSILKNTGELIGEYYGKAKQTKVYTIYKNGQLGLPAKTNKLFSRAIMEIRQQILKDSIN